MLPLNPIAYALCGSGSMPASRSAADLDKETSAKAMSLETEDGAVNAEQQIEVL